MGSFSVSGLEEVEKLFLNQDKIAVAAVPKMLEAGAAVIMKAQQSSATSMGLKLSGSLINSLTNGKIIEKGTATSITVYPKGKDHKGVRNATKGFFYEHGSSIGRRYKAKNARGGFRTRRKNIIARPWHSTAERSCEKATQQAMLKVWEEMSNA